MSYGEYWLPVERQKFPFLLLMEWAHFKIPRTFPFGIAEASHITKLAILIVNVLPKGMAFTPIFVSCGNRRIKPVMVLVSPFYWRLSKYDPCRPIVPGL